MKQVSSCCKPAGKKADEEDYRKRIKKEKVLTKMEIEKAADKKAARQRKGKCQGCNATFRSNDSTMTR